MRKPAFLHMQKQRRRSASRSVTAKLISAFVFATLIVRSLYFLNLKFQASSHLLWLYSPVCVGPGRKPRRPVFSERGSFYLLFSSCSTPHILRRWWFSTFVSMWSLMNVLFLQPTITIAHLGLSSLQIIQDLINIPYNRLF